MKMKMKMKVLPLRWIPTSAAALLVVTTSFPLLVKAELSRNVALFNWRELQENNQTQDATDEETSVEEDTTSQVGENTTTTNQVAEDPTGTSQQVEDDYKECPDYRYLDTVYPNTPIFGAPNGCRCWEGLSELHCSYCEMDAPCQQYDPNHGCRKGFRNSENDLRIAYACRLFGQYETLFNNGKASFYFDFQTGTANVSVFNTRNIDSFHLMDCQMTGCTFDMRGGSGASCELGFCECASNQCDGLVAQTIEQFSNQPADIIVEDPLGASSVVSIVVADQTLETNCTAATCTPDFDPDWDAYSQVPEETDSTTASTEPSAAATTIMAFSNRSRWMMMTTMLIVAAIFW